MSRRKHKIPCYTCKDKFIQDKRSVLLETTVNDVIQIAKNDSFTGTYVIIQRGNGTGFRFRKIEDVEPADIPERYLPFNKGIAV